MVRLRPLLVRLLASGLTLGLALAASGCVRDRGAVLVRWRIVNSSTGQAPQGCSNASSTVLTGEEKACCGRVTSERLGSSRDVIIDHIRLRAQKLGDVDQPNLKDVPCESCCFTCSPPESTTAFELPVGFYKLWIEALRCGVVVGQTPPAVVREVLNGGIVNLNSIEVRIDPETMPVTCPFANGISRGCAADSTVLDAGAALDLAPDLALTPPVDLAPSGG